MPGGRTGPSTESIRMDGAEQLEGQEGATDIQFGTRMLDPSA